MAQQNYIPYQVPEDVDRRLQQIRARIAAKRGVEVTKVSKSGETLRALLAVADAAEALGIVAAIDVPTGDTAGALQTGSFSAST